MRKQTYRLIDGKMVITAAYNYIVYNHLGGFYRPNNSRQMRCALRTNCVIQSPETAMHSARKEVPILFIVEVAKNTFLCPEVSASYNGKYCRYGAFINLV